MKTTVSSSLVHELKKICKELNLPTALSTASILL